MSYDCANIIHTPISFTFWNGGFVKSKKKTFHWEFRGNEKVHIHETLRKGPSVCARAFFSVHSFFFRNITEMILRLLSYIYVQCAMLWAVKSITFQPENTETTRQQQKPWIWKFHFGLKIQTKLRTKTRMLNHVA